MTRADDCRDVRVLRLRNSLREDRDAEPYVAEKVRNDVAAGSAEMAEQAENVAVVWMVWILGCSRAWTGNWIQVPEAFPA
jgi:hypothetical protein